MASGNVDSQAMAAQVAKTGHWVFNLENGNVVWSDGLYLVLGVKRGSFVPTAENFGDFLHPDDASLGTRETLEELLRRDFFEGEARIVDQSTGETKYLRLRTEVMKNAEGKPVLVHGTFQDVSEQKEMETALRESEERFRGIFEQAAAGVCSVDTTGRILRTNPVFCQLTGYTEEELRGRSIPDITHPEDYPRENEGIQSLLSGQRTTFSGEKRYLRKDGGTVWTNIGISMLRDAQGQPCGFVGVVQDITERKRAEEQKHELELRMLQAQKLESLGLLAGGIAHDFNNLLMGVLGNADLASQVLPPEAPGLVYIQGVKDTAARLADLTRQLLAYSGKGKFIVQRLDVSRLVQEMAHLLEITLPKKVVIQYDLDPGLPAIQADATQLRQVIMNLITNAAEAIGKDSGIVSLRTGSLEADPGTFSDAIGASDLAEGRYVFIEVADTGCGIDQASRDRIFEPFFTTKFTGRGLGLAAVLGIVRGHGGAIRVRSEKGQGSTFTVLFPSSVEAVREEAAERGHRVQRGSGTILVVDDEQSVRTVVKVILERAGFHVVCAEDGRQALEIFRAHSAAVVVVLLDLTMPNMDGIETFTELKRLKPDVRVILSSGYSEQDATSTLAGHGLRGFIQKPYSAEALVDKLFEVLDITE